MAKLQSQIKMWLEAEQEFDAEFSLQTELIHRCVENIQKWEMCVYPANI